MKALIPSQKENKRYLLVQGKNLKKNIPIAIKEYIGVLGMSQTSLSFISNSSGKAIISINREMINFVRGALTIFPEKIEVLKVSGTLKALRGKK
jgi:RNase P/RNase MRP subunit POP5